MVVEAGVGRVLAAAQERLVHDVVVVERGLVGELDDAGCGDDLVGERVRSALGGQQHQQRPEPLAAGLQQMRGRFRDERRAAAGVARQLLLHDRQPSAQPLLELGIGDREGEFRGSVGGCAGAHPMNPPASTNRLSTGPGITPNKTVARALRAITTEVAYDGLETVATSSRASVKNISMMTRT